MVEKYHAEDYHKAHKREDLESFGSIILLQMGLVFKQLYVDKNLVSRASETADYDEQEN